MPEAKETKVKKNTKEKKEKIVKKVKVDVTEVKKIPVETKKVTKEVKEVKEEIAKEPKLETLKKDKPLKKGFISGTGRRKEAKARVFLWEAKGDFTVNGQSVEKYFSGDVEQTKWVRPFHAVGVSHPEAKYSASIKVAGSGKSSQLDAVVLGISKALAKLDAEFDKTLRKQGFLTRDSRMVERKKPFLHKARKRPQYSKR
ncbi:MAG: 30S ribosomal protein S9 [Patescibacteria group bacterium]